jgi:hypothetical protein
MTEEDTMPMDRYENDARQARLTLALTALMAVISVAMIIAALLERP